MNLKILGIIGVLLLCFVSVDSVHAQNTEQSMAQVDLNNYGDESVDPGIQLSAALDRLEKVYDISFMYKSGLLVYKSVPSGIVEYDNLTLALKTLLEPYNLKYTRLNNSTFAISFDFAKFASKEEQKIQGTVTDATSDETLPGVNVVVKGTNTGTSTDSDGNFELNVPSLQDTLVFSFIGYQSKEVPINGRANIDITLQREAITGDELVVVGYGTQQEQQITGSISRVDEEDFVKGTIDNVSEMIQGKVPGLVVSSSGGGDPNSEQILRLRGISSFGANQEPLIVIDGIIGGNLRNLDPNDIASIDVLKDASASAIYGTRGSAGVIVVTTKTGQANEQTSIKYNGYVSLETVENNNNVLNAEEYKELSGLTGFNAPDLGASTDWFDKITQNPINHVHHVSISGGNETTNYRMSGNFRDRQGIQKKTGFKQTNARFNVTHRALDEKLKVTLNLGVTNREEDLGFPQAFRYAQTFNPTAPVKKDGFENTGGFFEQPLFDYFNPVAIIETGERKSEQQLFNGSIRGEYEFKDMIPKLSISAFYSTENDKRSFRRYFGKTNKLNGGATASALGNGQATRSESGGKEELFETTLNYITDINKLNIEALAGYSFNEEDSEVTRASGGEFITDAVAFHNLAYAQDFSQGEGSVTSFDGTHQIFGGFGRLSLNWNNTYFLNTSLRREASTRFGEENKWGTFWSLGGGIDLSSYLGISKLNQLKIRSSYGITGQDAPQNGLSKRLYGPQGSFFLNGEFVQSFAPISNPNPDLKWEEKKEFNLGLDFEVGTQLSGSFEYYDKQVDDLLFNVPVPVPPNLFPSTWKNIGELKSNGFEGTIDYNIVQKQDIHWNTNFNFAIFGKTVLEKFITNEVITLADAGTPGLATTSLIRVKEGEPIGQIFEKKFAGINSDGEWLFFNNNGEKVTEDNIGRDDFQVLGNGLPDYQLGLTNNIGYKNWDLTFFLRGVFGHQLVNTFRLFYQTPSQITSYNVLDSAFDISELKERQKMSSFFVEDADFVKLQNLTLGYNFPFSGNDNIRRLRVYLSINNAFTITGYDGINPEVKYTDGGNPLAPGIERRNQWFTARTLTVGLNLDF